MREADDGAHGHVAALQDRPRLPNVRGPDAHRRDVVLERQAAARLDEGVVELGPEQRMVDRLRDIAFCEAVDGERRRGRHLM